MGACLALGGLGVKDQCNWPSSGVSKESGLQGTCLGLEESAWHWCVWVLWSLVKSGAYFILSPPQKDTSLFAGLLGPRRGVTRAR